MGHSVNHNTARIADVQELRSLIEGFARCIIPCLPQDAEILKFLDQINIGMSSGNHQGNKRKYRWPIREKSGGYMAFKVIHADKGDSPCKGKCFCHGQPHQQRSDQSRPPGYSNSFDIIQVRPGVIQRLQDNRDDGFHMLPGGDLGNNAAVFAVHANLGGDDIGQKFRAVFDHCRRCLIAG